MSSQDNQRPEQPARDSHAAFAARGEAAWQQYLRDGVARPVDVVFDRIDALIAKRAKQLRADLDAAED